MNYSSLSKLKSHINASVVLIFFTLLALVCANTPIVKDWYFSLWQLPMSLSVGEFNFFSHDGHAITFGQMINDFLMAIFFLSVGLEIKREIKVGELSSVDKALLPIVGACGGMLIPVVVFFLICPADVTMQRGMAIPMATDIAFSLGVLSLFGKRVPISLKIFLTAFAVVDDIGGILVIALFYSSHLDVTCLLQAAIALMILCLGNRMKIHNRWFYTAVGFLLWYSFLQSGIHATIAGVIVAFTIPAKPSMHTGKYIHRIKNNINNFPTHKDEKGQIILSKEQISTLKSIESASDKVISPLQALEDDLHGFVNYIIIPLFAFANAGVVLTSEYGGHLEIGMLTWAVTIGLVAGKFIGIYLFTWLAIKSRMCTLPTGMNWANLTGISLLGGIGFTVSLFIANLSFGDDLVLLSQAKLGVLCGTAIAGILGYIVLALTLPRKH